MKRSVSFVVIAALLAGLTAFTTHRQVPLWNVNNPENGTPGFYLLQAAQVKAAFCPGLNNTECAMEVLNNNIIVKKP